MKFKKDDAKEIVTIYAKCKITLGLIKLSISGNLILNVKDANILKEVWPAITSFFEDKNDAKVLTLKSQVYSIKLHGSMMEHLQ